MAKHTILIGASGRVGRLVLGKRDATDLVAQFRSHSAIAQSSDLLWNIQDGLDPVLNAQKTSISNHKMWCR